VFRIDRGCFTNESTHFESAFLYRRVVRYCSGMPTNRLEIDMKKFAENVVAFLKEEDGPTAVEYAVMLALIIVTCLAAVQGLATNASAKFDQTAAILG
jgi:pilus assembly protein Flp/PilA